MRASTSVFAALLLSLASPSRADPNEQRQRHLALRRQRRSGASDPELAARCEKSARSPPAECRRRAPCDLRVFDPGRAFHRDVILQSRPREWAKNNVDAPNRHFQNGVEWWVHRALPPPAGEGNASALVGARRVFVAAYFSYMFIFAPHKVPAALSAIEAGLGAGWRRGGRNVVAHGHPGACVGGTSGAVRLLVDDCSSCGGSRPYIAVPYVVSRPAWLVAAEPPPGRNRSILLFFRGHLPRVSIESRSVRRTMLKALAGQPDALVEAATARPGASYEPHGDYLKKMLRATFCLSPRGDTSSSKRTYESIAAGCIPVIIADGLRLPFERWLDWTAFSVRVKEASALADPLSVLRTLRAIPAARVAAMQAALREARPHFLWHLDPSRPSAVDAILREMCDGPPS